MLNIDKEKMIQFGKQGLIYVLALYIVVILGRSIWLNWSLKQEVDRIKQDITNIQAQNQNLSNLILYYQSDSFKELEAREKLGLKRADEKVVSVPVQKYDLNFQDETAADQKSLTGEIKKKKIPNWQAWWHFIFW